jgi:hypothetical protein
MVVIDRKSNGAHFFNIIAFIAALLPFANGKKIVCDYFFPSK